MGTSVERSSANTDLASRVDSYGMAHSKVDGQDYFAVRGAAQPIIENMRKNPAPYFLEAITYRYSVMERRTARKPSLPIATPKNWTCGKSATRFRF